MNELQLTKESIANEGIEIKLTQADVIDALVDEQMEIINNRYESIRQEYVEIKRFCTEERERIAIKHFEEVKKKLPKFVIVDEKPHFNFLQIENKGRDLVMYNLSKYSNGKTISYDKHNYRFNTHILVKATFSVQIKCSSDVNLDSTTCSFTFSHKDSSSLLKRLNEHNLRVEQFLNDFPGEINPSKISKDIKNKFTKEILKTSSPDFRKKLKAGFGVTL